MFRLYKRPRRGHFNLDGSQPHETTRPTALHYVTFNLIGWVHVAQVVEAAREHSEKPGSFLSLWSVKHDDEVDQPEAVPVLCKAIRWIAQFLPRDDLYYLQYTEPFEGMGVDFPFQQVTIICKQMRVGDRYYCAVIYELQLRKPSVTTLKIVSSSASPSSFSSTEIFLLAADLLIMDARAPFFFQADRYAFSRLLEIVHYGVLIYGTEAIFPQVCWQ